MSERIRRVLLFSDAPVYGGGERYLLELARALPRDRFRVEAVASVEGAVDHWVRELERLGVPVRRLPAIPTLSARRPFLKMLRWFATHRPEVLHFNLVDPRACNGAMAAAWLALRRSFVVTEHLPRSPFDGRPLPFRHRLAARHTAVTIVNTEADRAVVEARPHHRSRVAVIPNGIADPGAPSESRRRAARTALGFGEHAGPLVGFIGRFIPQKNPGLFVEGLRRASPRFPDARFILLGDGPELPRIQRLVAELGFGEVTRFYGHRDDAPELVFGLDLLVSTSRYEGMPFSILEAMAAEVPVVAQRIPGTEDLVAHGASGLLVAREDGDALGAALGELLAAPDRLRQMGIVARQRQLTLFSAEAMARQTARVYDSL